MFKQVAALLPDSAQDSLKRMRFRRQIRSGTFIPHNEPEMRVISNTVRSGDWVIDVGANVGHYTCHLSNCAGRAGRVIAFEPIPQTFALLTANVLALDHHNVTLLNAAASDRLGVAAMSLPKLPSGLTNYYRAALAQSGDYSVLCIPIDTLNLPPVSLIKIDAEGHDLAVLRGTQKLLERDKPTLIVECALDDEVAGWIRERGYELTRAEGSPNVVARVAH
jgi:FkbM family methyltransferase